MYIFNNKDALIIDMIIMPSGKRGDPVSMPSESESHTLSQDITNRMNLKISGRH